jgi:hypothetical protein
MRAQRFARGTCFPFFSLSVKSSIWLVYGVCVSLDMLTMHKIEPHTRFVRIYGVSPATTTVANTIKAMIKLAPFKSHVYN